MGYEWFDDIDAIAYHFEECVEVAAKAHGALLGMAPSAGDALRTHLRNRTTNRKPLLLITECETVKRADVEEATNLAAEAAVLNATSRDSQHVTREDVEAALKTATYPFN
jgi:hypothetical protein